MEIQRLIRTELADFIQKMGQLGVRFKFRSGVRENIFLLNFRIEVSDTHIGMYFSLTEINRIVTWRPL